MDFQKFSHYIHNTLEIYRHQLQTLLFPVFTHVYLKLVTTQQLTDAKQLLALHGEPFDIAFSTEMANLRLIVDHDHMKQNAWAKHILGSPESFSVTVGTTAQMLLITYLEEHQMKEILQILNSKMKLNTTYVHPSTANNNADDNNNPLKRSAATLNPASASSSSSSSSSSSTSSATAPAIGTLSGNGVTGTSHYEQYHINKRPLNWGVVSKRPRKDITAKVQQLKSELQTFVSTEDKTMKLTEKKKMQRKMETTIRETEIVARKPLWIGATGPSPDLNQDFYRDMVEKLMVRVKPVQKKQEEQDSMACVMLGYAQDHRENNSGGGGGGGGSNSANNSSSSDNANDAQNAVQDAPLLPSVSCYSLKNNYDSLCCTNVSRDGVQVAGGYSDGVVRVWRLDGDTNLGETYGYVNANEDKQDSPLATTKNGLIESSTLLIGHKMGVTGKKHRFENVLM